MLIRGGAVAVPGRQDRHVVIAGHYVCKAGQCLLLANKIMLAQSGRQRDILGVSFSARSCHEGMNGLARKATATSGGVNHCICG